jgi:membrane protease subunit HflC
MATQTDDIFKWVWRGLAFTSMVGLCLFSFRNIEPGEAAVKINNITGSQESITQPGWLTNVPFVHSTYILDGAPRQFVMSGNKDKDQLHVRALTVRASDGSNFYFDDTKLTFQLDRSQATQVIQDSGEKDAFISWVKPYVRSILRDEFGLESTIAVSDPSNYEEAVERAKKRLNEKLRPHGVEVTQLVTPKPRFSDAYESSIEARNSLGNQLGVIASNLERADTSRARQLSEVGQSKNNAMQERRAALEQLLATASASQARVKQEVDTYKIAKMAEGQAALSAAGHKADELEGEYEAKFIAQKAEVDAFKSLPVERVMQRLGEQLENVTIDIQPWAADSSPTTVKYEEVRRGKQ